MARWPKESRHKRGYNSRWDRIRLVALRRDSHLCQVCLGKGHVTQAREVDHIKPKYKGGTDELSNLQSICTDCHRDKTSREAAEAQGRTPRKKVEFDAAGRVIWDR